MRGKGEAASNRIKTHCPEGHPYTPENTICYANGSRRCRACHRATCSAYKKRKRQGITDYHRRNNNLIEEVIGRLIRREGGCWEWPAAVESGGYGLVSIHRKPVRVHRLVYEHLKGPIPEGLVLDHLCRNTCCANPDHLEPVTPAENMRRGNSPMARFAQRTHCPMGHPLSGKNLYVEKYSSGRTARRCRACRAEQSRQFRKANPDYYTPDECRKRANKKASHPA